MDKYQVTLFKMIIFTVITVDFMNARSIQLLRLNCNGNICQPHTSSKQRTTANRRNSRGSEHKATGIRTGAWTSLIQVTPNSLKQKGINDFYNIKQRENSKIFLEDDEHGTLKAVEVNNIENDKNLNYKFNDNHSRHGSEVGTEDLKKDDHHENSLENVDIVKVLVQENVISTTERYISEISDVTDTENNTINSPQKNICNSSLSSDTPWNFELSKRCKEEGNKPVAQIPEIPLGGVNLGNPNLNTLESNIIYSPQTQRPQAIGQNGYYGQFSPQGALTSYQPQPNVGYYNRPNLRPNPMYYNQATINPQNVGQNTVSYGQYVQRPQNTGYNSRPSYSELNTGYINQMKPQSVGQNVQYFLEPISRLQGYGQNTGHHNLVAGPKPYLGYYNQLRPKPQDFGQNTQYYDQGTFRPQGTVNNYGIQKPGYRIPSNHVPQQNSQNYIQKPVGTLCTYGEQGQVNKCIDEGVHPVQQTEGNPWNFDLIKGTKEPNKTDCSAGMNLCKSENNSSDSQVAHSNETSWNIEIGNEETLFNDDLPVSSTVRPKETDCNEMGCIQYPNTEGEGGNGSVGDNSTDVSVKLETLDAPPWNFDSDLTPQANTNIDGTDHVTPPVTSEKPESLEEVSHSNETSWNFEIDNVEMTSSENSTESNTIGPIETDCKKKGCNQTFSIGSEGGNGTVADNSSHVNENPETLADAPPWNFDSNQTPQASTSGEEVNHFPQKPQINRPNLTPCHPEFNNRKDVPKNSNANSHKTGNPWNFELNPGGGDCTGEVSQVPQGTGCLPNEIGCYTENYNFGISHNQRPYTDIYNHGDYRPPLVGGNTGDYPNTFPGSQGIYKPQNRPEGYYDGQNQLNTGIYDDFHAPQSTYETGYFGSKYPFPGFSPSTGTYNEAYPRPQNNYVNYYDNYQPPQWAGSVMETYGQNNIESTSTTTQATQTSSTTESYQSSATTQTTSVSTTTQTTSTSATTNTSTTTQPSISIECQGNHCNNMASVMETFMQMAQDGNVRRFLQQILRVLRSIGSVLQNLRGFNINQGLSRIVQGITRLGSAGETFMQTQQVIGHNSNKLMDKLDKLVQFVQPVVPFVQVQSVLQSFTKLVHSLPPVLTEQMKMVQMFMGKFSSPAPQRRVVPVKLIRPIQPYQPINSLPLNQFHPQTPLQPNGPLQPLLLLPQSQIRPPPVPTQRPSPQPGGFVPFVNGLVSNIKDNFLHSFLPNWLVP